MSLPGGRVPEGLDKEINRWVVRAPRPLKTDGPRLGPGGRGELTDHARGLIRVLRPDQMPDDDKDHGWASGHEVDCRNRYVAA